MSVDAYFKEFCDKIIVDDDTKSKIEGRFKAIVKRLNKDFWNWDSDTAFGKYVGSYGRDTARRGFSDLDMIFQLPSSIKAQYDNYIGNGQSALLQAVKRSIAVTYPNTYLKGDGQVVKIDFYDGMSFEVVPAFQNSDKSYTYPDSNDGGKWKKTDPLPEIDTIASYDKIYNYNLKPLCRMTRSWRKFWNVPMGGLLIDTLAARFMVHWYHNKESYLYYDYMSRDFFKFLADQDPEQTLWFAIGSNQHVYRQGKFEYKAKQCYNLALEAIAYQEKGYEYSAKQKWRAIYGSQFPE